MYEHTTICLQGQGEADLLKELEIERTRVAALVAALNAAKTERDAATAELARLKGTASAGDDAGALTSQQLRIGYVLDSQMIRSLPEVGKS